MTVPNLVLAEALVHDAAPRRKDSFAKIIALLSTLIGLGCVALWTRGEDDQYLADAEPSILMSAETGEPHPSGVSCAKVGSCIRGDGKSCQYEPGFEHLARLSTVTPALARELSTTENDAKTHMSVVICGHIDSGKSTTTGRLIYELGGLGEREMEKLRLEAEALGKQSFAFAFFMDRCKEERARGVTIQCTTKEFFTNQWHYTIIDAPGHADFIKNMISGAAQADVALLMVPADGYATAIAKGDRRTGEVQGQTRAHARLINLLGVKQLLVGINKMDSDSAGPYSQEKYNEVKEAMGTMLTKVGWKPAFVKDNVPMLPISGWQGDNLITQSKKMDWWKGLDVKDTSGNVIHVDTLLECLDLFCKPPERDTALAKPLRVPINGVYKIKGSGDVLTGRVEQGKVKPGDEVVFLPSHTEKFSCAGKVFSVEMHHKQVPQAGPGDNVGMNVKNLDKKAMPKTGDVMILKTDKTLKGCKKFTAQIQTLENAPKIKLGYCPFAYVRCGHSSCKIVDIMWKMGKATGGSKVETTEASDKTLAANMMAEVVFENLSPFVVDTAKNCEGLARIAFLEGNSCAMLGNIKCME